MATIRESEPCVTAYTVSHGLPKGSDHRTNLHSINRFGDGHGIAIGVGNGVCARETSTLDTEVSIRTRDYGGVVVHHRLARGCRICTTCALCVGSLNTICDRGCPKRNEMGIDRRRTTINLRVISPVDRTFQGIGNGIAIGVGCTPPRNRVRFTSIDSGRHCNRGRCRRGGVRESNITSVAIRGVRYRKSRHKIYGGTNTVVTIVCVIISSSAVSFDRVGAVSEI